MFRCKTPCSCFQPCVAVDVDFNALQAIAYMRALNASMHSRALHHLARFAQQLQLHFGFAAIGLSCPQQLSTLLTSHARFCCIALHTCSTKSAAEQATCNKMIAILKANKAVNTWECVQEDNAEACMAAVELGAADVVSVGASAVFKASEKFGVQLIAGEVRLFFSPLVHTNKEAYTRH
jgi:Transferrin